ncbi:ATP-dependent acyl-CoA ligase [Rubrobacter taiwanensis]|uniref:ATP-dependent acyl-CoA ligase n=1 Tax=Rubrobacter taiwanensis TaxID=185139 RepID=UPI001A9E7BD0|nr:ATP-dependent acyl-CoA ligase [Rubrobacter taiwanensis]
MESVARLGLDRIPDLGTLTARAAARWAGRTALTFDETGESLTYGEVEGRSNRIAHVLGELGVGFGDRVGVMLRNRPEFPLTWLALAKLGAVMVPINVYYRELDARYVLEHSGAKLVVTSSEFVPLLEEIRARSGALERVVSVDGGFKSLLEAAAGEPPGVRVYPENLASIQYTSGTTGPPKGCMLSHGFWVHKFRKHIEQPEPPVNESDVLLTAQPYHYIDPQWNTLVSLASGAPLVVLDRFHPSTFWEKVRRYGITFFFCIGAMPTLMLKMPSTPEDRDHRVRHIICSGIPKNIHRELEERWGAPWHEWFGMTETGGDISVRQDEHDELVGTGCIGRPHYTREARIVDDSDRPVPRGETGELALRGPGMMDGYYRMPEETAEAFRNGWFHTGDLARMDEEGRIYYVGRKKARIRRSGENVSAEEVEGALESHPEVRSAACIPVPDEIRGEEIKAYIVLRPGASPESVPPQELAEFCSEKLAYFKVPRYWEYREELPRTPSERVARHLLQREKEDLRAGSYDRVDGVWR